jgi:beta-aspartyl-peptidase (threonine type)
MAAMRKGNSLDGVVQAVYYMEESGVFNAGRGSCLTVDGRMQLDAAVMRGDTRKGAGVGLVSCTYHPVVLARWLSEHTPAGLVVGEECESYAGAAGLKTTVLKPTPASLSKFEKLKETSQTGKTNARIWARARGGGTVGAVAIDSGGLVSAAVSTGGMWMKLPGRIGDSAILGAGIYADNRAGAACATGTGEEIIRNSICSRAVDMLSETDAQTAARRAISLMTRWSGRSTAGIITVDRKGRIGRSFNTEAMGTAWFDRRLGRAVVKI